MSSAVVKMSEAMLWEIPDPEPNHRYMGIMFERDITPTANLASGFVILPPKQEQQRLSIHEGQEEVYFVAQGQGQFVLDEKILDVDQGTAIYIKPGCRHRAINTGDQEMILFYVNTPPVFGPVGAYKELTKNWKRIR